MESWFRSFQDEARRQFKSRQLPSQPHHYLLEFSSTRGAGPLDVLEVLSDDGRADYTNALLGLDSVYQSWVMRHDSRPDHYPELPVDSPAVRILRAHGALRTPSGVVPLADALGVRPKNHETRDVLLARPNADRIKTAFGLTEPATEFFGEEDPVPLSDVWPGFQPVLRNLDELGRLVNELQAPPDGLRPLRQLLDLGLQRVLRRLDESNLGVVRCERILVGGDEHDCLLHASNIYLSRTADGSRGLVRALQQLLGLVGESEGVLASVSERIIRYSPPPSVDEQRTAIRELATDAERPLKAVGESGLRRHLPESLLAILENEAAPLTGVAVDYQKTIVAQVRDMLRDVNGGPGQTTSGAATGTVLHAYEMQVRKVDPAWPVLVFATSVEHAQTIAALLSTRGVPSRAVSGTTEASTRRRIVEDFRRGDLKCSSTTACSERDSTRPGHA